jgi:hypothetical protein
VRILDVDSDDLPGVGSADTKPLADDVVFGDLALDAHGAGSDLADRRPAQESGTARYRCPTSQGLSSPCFSSAPMTDDDREHGR